MISLVTSEPSGKQVAIWSGVALFLAALLAILLTNREEATTPAPAETVDLNSNSIVPTETIQVEQVAKARNREQNSAPASPAAVMAKRAPRIDGTEDLLALMRDSEIKRTRLLGSWHTGSQEDGCSSMVFLIKPPTAEEYNRWQEMASQLQSGGDKGKQAEMRKAINAMDKGFAFGDTPMYVKVLVPDADGKEVSIMSGLVQSENNLSYNDDGSISVSNLQKFKLQTSDRISKDSRFGHLVDFGSNYQTEK